MAKYHKKKKEGTKENARQHIIELLEEAGKVAVAKPELAKRYVFMARKISSRLKVSIPDNLKRRFCKACGAYFTSKNSRIRLNKGKKTYYCLVCQSLKRVPYK
ncbi:ribonuclease P [Candidatus Woesearchaeota archaeon]|nr:ribonuclease P [Candidatus Woesearchaeota archaeon]